MTAPFGIEFGTAMDQLKVVQSLQQGMATIEPPKPHPLLERYVVQATPQLGVVWIKGIGPSIHSDNYGTATKNAVDRLAEQLSQKYGRGKKTDVLLHGSIWTEPQDWMNGLCNHEQLYSYDWERKVVAGLPEDIESIFVGAIGLAGGEAAVAIEYASSKHAQAQLELDKLMADLL